MFGKGASLSGKSTVFNYLNVLYGDGFTLSDRREGRESIIGHLICVFKSAMMDADLRLNSEDREVMSHQ